MNPVSAPASPLADGLLNICVLAVDPIGSLADHHPDLRGTHGTANIVLGNFALQQASDLLNCLPAPGASLRTHSNLESIRLSSWVMAAVTWSIYLLAFTTKSGDAAFADPEGVRCGPQAGSCSSGEGVGYEARGPSSFISVVFSRCMPEFALLMPGEAFHLLGR